MKKILIFLFCISFLTSCAKRKDYKVVSGDPGDAYFVAFDYVRKIWNRSTKYNFEELQVSAGNSNDNIDLLASGEVDLCIAQNDAILQLKSRGADMNRYDNVRTLIPLYPEILFIVHKKEIQASSLRELLTGRVVAMGPRTSGTAFFAKRVFEEFGLDTTVYTPFHSPKWSENTISDSVDVACALTAFNWNRINKMLSEKGGKLFSLGDPTQANLGSAVDGFCWHYYAARPFIIPIGTYGGKPEKPVLTVAVDAVVCIDEAVNDDIVYELIETLIQNKQRAIADNILLADVTTDFNPDKLGFPLHPGARMYLDKDKPTFLEKWSEPMALGFSILIAIAGGVSSFVKWRNIQKKDRIDFFYQHILAVEEDSNKENLSRAELEELIKRVDNLRREAFRELIKEKLKADESFRIFVTMQQDVLDKIYRRLGS